MCVISSVIFMYFRDAVIVSVINCGTSVFAGFVIFSVLGFMAYTKGVDVAHVVDSGKAKLFLVFLLCWIALHCVKSFRNGGEGGEELLLKKTFSIHLSQIGVIVFFLTSALSLFVIAVFYLSIFFSILDFSTAACNVVK